MRVANCTADEALKKKKDEQKRKKKVMELVKQERRK